MALGHTLDLNSYSRLTPSRDVQNYCLLYSGGPANEGRLWRQAQPQDGLPGILMMMPSH